MFDVENKWKISWVVDQRIRLVRKSEKGKIVWYIEEFKVFYISVMERI